MDSRTRLTKKARILLDRLERLSADSGWAHRASGLRGALLKMLGQANIGDNQKSFHQIQEYIQNGYTILNNAAREIKSQEKTVAEEIKEKQDE